MQRIVNTTVIVAFVILAILGGQTKDLTAPQTIEEVVVPITTKVVKAEEIYITATPTPTPVPTSKPVLYDPQETVFDVFSDEEIAMVERLVEAEATAGNFYDKVNVANVVYNRYYSDEFPDTIEGVVFQHNDKYYQFSCIPDNRYYEVEVTKETKEAVQYAFIHKDTTYGALYFCNAADVKNMSAKAWFKTLKHTITDDVGHSYYK